LTTEERAKSSTIVRSAGIVSIAVALSRVTGLVRERVMAGLFGASMVNDAFQIAFRIPNLTRDLFAEGALSSAFVPIFTEYLTKRSKKDAVELANLVATSILIVVGGLCVLGILFAPALVNVFASGYGDVPGKFELTVRLTRVMFPFLLLVALAAQVMGVLNALGQFGVPALASTFFNIGSLVFGLSLGVWLGPYIGISRIEGMAYGVVLGGALQLLWQIPAMYRAGFRFSPKLNWQHEGLRRIFAMMGPAILGSAAVQINAMVNTNFATTIDDPLRGPNGAVSWLLYAFRFMQLPLGLFGVAIGSATLPSISRSAAAGNLDEFRRTLSRSLGMVFLLTVPSSVGLAVLGPSIVGAIYEVGRFDAYDTRQTALALSCYAIGLAGYAATKVLTPAFYALGDANVPMYVSLSSIGINLAAVLMLLRFTNLGHAGMALSVSVVALSSSLALFLLIRRKVGGIYGRQLFESVSKVALASLAMGIAVWFSTSAVQSWFGTRPAARLIDLGISIPVGMVVLYVIARTLRVAELEMAVDAVSGPIARRVPFLRAKMLKP
jgi:putative peptidoglycan lipid II flippase